MRSWNEFRSASPWLVCTWTASTAEFAADAKSKVIQLTMCRKACIGISVLMLRLDGFSISEYENIGHLTKTLPSTETRAGRNPLPASSPFPEPRGMHPLPSRSVQNCARSSVQ
jgi:hypothetical protein